MSSSIEQDLYNLIVKYELTKFTEKFENEGITSYRHVKDIDRDRLRSYYNMLQVDLTNFEKLRSECIKSSVKSDTPILAPPIPSLPETLESLPISLPNYENSGPIAINESMPRLVGDASNSIQDGAYLLDYHTDKAVGELKMKGSTPCIQTFPNQVIIQDETLLCDLHSQIPVCEMKVKNRTPYVIPVANKENVNISRSQENFSNTCDYISMFIPTPFPRYDLTAVNGYRGLGLIIVNANFDDPNNFREGADKDVIMLEELFDKMNLRKEILKDSKKEQCLKSIKEHIDKAVSDKIIVIAISSHGEDGDKFACTDGVIQIQKVIDLLKIPGLRGIPKVLIIQACRGEKSDPVEDNISQTAEFYPSSTKESDILIAYSSVHGYVANRDPEEGSWFIQSLLEAYNQGHTHGHELADFQQILTCTNNLMLTEKVCEKSGVIWKQSSQTVSTLNKLIYL